MDRTCKDVRRGQHNNFFAENFHQLHNREVVNDFPAVNPVTVTEKYRRTAQLWYWTRGTRIDADATPKETD